MKHHICNTTNGTLVYVDLIHSKAAIHIAHQPHLLGLIQEVLRSATLRDATVSLEYDMKRVIGNDFVVSTSDSDSIFYAQPLREEVFARYVKNGKPLPAQHISLILARDEQGDYELLDSWIGHISPPRPGSANETTESKNYWSNHAFISDRQLIQLRTATKVCPY